MPTLTIPGGATIERDIPLALGTDGEVRFLLRRPDFTNARRVAEAINAAGTPCPETSATNNPAVGPLVGRNS